MKAEAMKQYVLSKGADICGIASADDFGEAPEGFHPQDVLPEARSVVVFGKSFLAGTFSAKSTIPYTILRNKLSETNDYMSIDIAYYLESHGAIAVPTGAIEPCEWDTKTERIRGIISLKHSAVLAGLGTLGKNTLLLNNKHGNKLWLGAVITSMEIEPDPPADYDLCSEKCTLCIQKCPVNALGGELMNQKDCWDYAFGHPEEGGEWRIKCFQCRKVCPNT